MLQQTINGKDVVIIFDNKTSIYTVMYEGEMIKMKKRPVTDQDIWRLEQVKEVKLAKDLGIMLANLMVLGLNN